MGRFLIAVVQLARNSARDGFALVKIVARDHEFWRFIRLNGDGCERDVRIGFAVVDHHGDRTVAEVIRCGAEADGLDCRFEISFRCGLARFYGQDDGALVPAQTREDRVRHLAEAQSVAINSAAVDADRRPGQVRAITVLDGDVVIRDGHAGVSKREAGLVAAARCTAGIVTVQVHRWGDVARIDRDRIRVTAGFVLGRIGVAVGNLDGHATGYWSRAWAALGESDRADQILVGADVSFAGQHDGGGVAAIGLLNGGQGVIDAHARAVAVARGEGGVDDVVGPHVGQGDRGPAQLSAVGVANLQVGDDVSCGAVFVIRAAIEGDGGGNVACIDRDQIRVSAGFVLGRIGVAVGNLDGHATGYWSRAWAALGESDRADQVLVGADVSFAGQHDGGGVAAVGLLNGGQGVIDAHARAVAVARGEGGVDDVVGPHVGQGDRGPAQLSAVGVANLQVGDDVSCGAVFVIRAAIEGDGGGSVSRSRRGARRSQVNRGRCQTGFAAVVGNSHGNRTRTGLIGGRSEGDGLDDSLVFGVGRVASQHDVGVGTARVEFDVASEIGSAGVQLVAGFRAGQVDGRACQGVFVIGNGGTCCGDPDGDAFGVARHINGQVDAIDRAVEVNDRRFVPGHRRGARRSQVNRGRCRACLAFVVSHNDGNRTRTGLIGGRREGDGLDDSLVFGVSRVASQHDVGVGTARVEFDVASEIGSAGVQLVAGFRAGQVDGRACQGVFVIGNGGTCCGDPDGDAFGVARYINGQVEAIGCAIEVYDRRFVPGHRRGARRSQVNRGRCRACLAFVVGDNDGN